MRKLALLALLPLAACATPGERCERAATEELRIIDQLIAETRLNIDRGYALVQEIADRPNLRFCYGNRIDRHAGVVYCNRTEPRLVERPVAIDVKVEEAKLKSLRAKRPQVASKAARQIAACRNQYPADS